jgi:hypothetical protein
MKKVITFLGHGLLTMAMGTCLCLVGCACQNPLGANLPANTVIPAGTTINKSLANCEYDVGTWVCSNRTTIMGYITAAETTENTVNTEFPGVIPVEYQAVLVAAEAVINTGEAALAASSCPSDTDAANVQAATIALSKQRANVNGGRWTQGKKLIP